MKGFLKKGLASLAVAIGLMAAMPALALAHDNVIHAGSVCTSQKNGTWQATFTGTNDYRLSETMTFTGAVSGSVAVGAFGSASKTVGGLTGNSAVAGVYGSWSDGYHNGPPANHYATAYRPENCLPVGHQPVIQGSAVCSKHGKYVVRYTLVNDDGGVTQTVFPVIHRVPGTSTSDSLSVLFVYGNGPDQTATARVSLRGTCHGPKLPPPVVLLPKAHFEGPCGDPMYRVVFNNRASNRAVTFRWSYVSFATGRTVTLERRVGAGQRVETGLRHVTGNTRMTIRRANGKLLASALAAPPGNYRPCS